LIKAIVWQRREVGVVEILHALGGCNVEGAQVLSKTISDAEADLLSRFMALPSTHRFYPFSYKARKIVSESYSPKISKQNLSQKVTSLLDKGYLYRDEDNFIDYNPVLKKMLELKEFNVTIVNRSTDKEDVTSS